MEAAAVENEILCVFHQHGNLYIRVSFIFQHLTTFFFFKSSFGVAGLHVKAIWYAWMFMFIFGYVNEA